MTSSGRRGRVEDRVEVRGDLGGRHLEDAVVPLREPRPLLRPRLGRARILARRHDVDDGSQRKRYEIGDMRTNRNQPLEAAGEAPVVDQRDPQRPLRVGRDCAAGAA